MAPPTLEVPKEGSIGPPGLQEVRFPLEALDSFRDAPALEPYLGTESLPPPWVVDSVQQGAATDERYGRDVSDSSSDGESEGSLEEVEGDHLPFRELFRNYPEMRNSLRSSQLEAIRFALARKGRALVALDMGLGKSLTALVIAWLYSEEWPMLVIAPTSVVDNWAKEIETWMPDMAQMCQVLQAGKHGRPDPRKMIILGSYEQIVGSRSKQVRHDGEPYGVVVIDEAHFIKSPEAVRTAKILPICQSAKRCILLSGTPVMNCAAEVWSLLAALMPDGCGSYESFCARYSSDQVEHRTSKGTKSRQIGAACEKELHLLMSSVMIRRRKHDALPNLGQKKRIVKRISEDCVDKKYASLIHKHQARMIMLKRQYGGGRANVVSRIYSLTAKAKAPVVANYVVSLLSSEDKVVVFAHHHCILDKVEDQLQEEGHRVVRVDGKVDRHQRTELIDSFQNDPDVRVAIMAITAAGQGISLTAARIAVFGELHWVPGKLIQAEDRVHRQGQTREVEIHYMVLGDDTFIDMKQLRILKQKDTDMGRILEGKAEDPRFEPLPRLRRLRPR